VLLGTILAGLFVCWLGVGHCMSSRSQRLVGVFPGQRAVFLDRVQVTGILHEVKADDGTGFLTLIGIYHGVSVVCKCRSAVEARGVGVGDVVSIHSRAGRDEEVTSSALLLDCEVVGWLVRAEE
jgi:hypothetical protein